MRPTLGPRAKPMAKHRNGPTGAIPVRFNFALARARFENLAHEDTVA